MRLSAYPGPLQIEAPVVIPDTTQASFRDDELYGIVRFMGRLRADDRHPGMRLGAYPGPLQIEAPVVIPDTTQASFRDDELYLF